VKNVRGSLFAVPGLSLVFPLPDANGFREVTEQKVAQVFNLCSPERETIKRCNPMKKPRTLA